MLKLPVVKSKELIRALERLGFYRHRKSRGSHLVMTHFDGRRIIVPVHYGKDIPKGTLQGIIKDLNIRREDFFSLL
ncbi:MAG: type II toxin-antitoxin system HicA family toxin [Patescibacteria group bacterium]